MVKDNNISIIKKNIETYDKMYDMCQAYVAYLVDLTGNDTYEIITGCGYYSDKKQCIEMYQLRNKKYQKIISCDDK